MFWNVNKMIMVFEQVNNNKNLQNLFFSLFHSKSCFLFQGHTFLHISKHFITNAVEFFCCGYWLSDIILSFSLKKITHTRTRTSTHTYMVSIL
jgi:hypothetical protein